MQCFSLLTSDAVGGLHDEGFILEDDSGNHALISEEHGDSLAVFTTEEFAEGFSEKFGLSSVHIRLLDRGSLLEVALSKPGCVGYCLADTIGP